VLAHLNDALQALRVPVDSGRSISYTTHHCGKLPETTSNIIATAPADEAALADTPHRSIGAVHARSDPRERHPRR